MHNTQGVEIIRSEKFASWCRQRQYKSEQFVNPQTSLSHQEVHAELFCDNKLIARSLPSYWGVAEVWFPLYVMMSVCRHLNMLLLFTVWGISLASKLT